MRRCRNTTTHDRIDEPGFEVIPASPSHKEAFLAPSGQEKNASGKRELSTQRKRTSPRNIFSAMPQDAGLLACDTQDMTRPTSLEIRPVLKQKIKWEPRRWPGLMLNYILWMSQHLLVFGRFVTDPKSSCLVSIFLARILSDSMVRGGIRGSC